MKLPYCSIIVLNYNGKSYLKECFDALRRINYPKNRYEVIFVDNGSTDGSVKYVKRSFPWVKVLRLKKNYGFAEGNNKGLKVAKGEYVVFLNNDTKVDKNWLIELVKVASSDKKIGVCGSKIFNLGDKGVKTIVGDGHVNIFGMVKNSEKIESLGKTFFVSGCSFLIKRSVLSKLKYCFDPTFFAYFEDVDLCWRVWLLGYKVYYVPTSVVLHKKAMTVSAIGDVMKFNHYRNKILTFKKNLRFPLTQISLLSIFLTTLFMILYWKFKGRWSFGISVLRYVFTKIEKNPLLNQISLKKQLKLFTI